MTLDNDPDGQLEIKNLKLAKKEMVNRNEDVPDLPSTDSDSELEPDPNAYLKMREEKIRENQLKLAAMFSSFETAGDITDTTQLDTAANSFSFSSLRLRSFPPNNDGDNAGLPSPDPRRRLSRSASVNEYIYLTAKQVDEQQEKHELAYNMRLQASSTSRYRSSRDSSECDPSGMSKWSSSQVVDKLTKETGDHQQHGGDSQGRSNTCEHDQKFVPLRFIFCHVEVPRRSIRTSRTAGTKYRILDQDHWRERGRGIQVRHRRVYDSIHGTSCHQCRQKTTNPKSHCPECPTMYDLNCLEGRYGETEEDTKVEGWLCPKCRGICSCSQCRRKKGLAPTGQLVQLVRQKGFKSVAEYLNDKSQSTIVQRKILTASAATRTRAGTR